MLPAFHDPFAGGGSLPLEAQRLGLEAHASDLNPVAVLINKAMIEIPPKFAGRPPVNPESRSGQAQMDVVWRGAQGLAEDVRYYGKWMRDEAAKRIGHLYPKVRVTEEMAKDRPDLEDYVGRELTVIAWLWARTVKSPNPAFADVDVPLASTFILSKKKAKEAWVAPVIDANGYRFTVKAGAPPEWAVKGTKLARANFRCLMSGTPITGDYIKAQGQAGRMGARLMAIVAEGDRGRVYFAPTLEHEQVALQAAQPDWRPAGNVPARLTGGTCVPYGLDEWWKLFTDRQLVALTTLSDLATEARERVQRDAIAADMSDDGMALRDGGTGATAYAEAAVVYLGLLVDQVANHCSSMCGWNNTNTQMRSVFARQAIPMVWDYAESNPFCESSGSYANLFERQVKGFFALGERQYGVAWQADVNSLNTPSHRIVSTDPPYYDNIAYADLSDFFYVWLRRSLRPVFPELFSTLAVPKAEELVATRYRHGSKERAEAFFLKGMIEAMRRLAKETHPVFPLTVYYAFKQSETALGATANTGWNTFLDALLQAGFAVSGTWPVRTEKQGRVIGNNTNALAASIALVCRPRATDATVATRREFQGVLRAEFPQAVAHLQGSNIAPVDLAQASIGPGMAVFTSYREVLNADASKMSVRDALALINATLDEVLAEQEGDFDADTRWAVTWSEQFGYDDGEYGVAEQLSKAKNTSVDGLVRAGIIESSRGAVRIFRPAELNEGWDPATDSRLTVWEMTQHLIRLLESGGEQAAGELAAKLGSQAEAARDLAYRLYLISERKRRAADALAYNGLVQSWPEIVRIAGEQRATPETQGAFGIDGP